MDYNNQTKHPFLKVVDKGGRVIPNPMSIFSSEMALRNTFSTRNGYISVRVFTGFETSSGDPLYFGDTVWYTYDHNQYPIRRSKNGAPIIDYAYIEDVLDKISIHPPEREEKRVKQRRVTNISKRCKCGNEYATRSGNDRRKSTNDL